jgi:hypothetical protein
MRKAIWLVSLLLLLMATEGFAEVGVGISAAYPIYLIGELGFEPQALFAGASVRWKPSWFLLDAGFSFCLAGGLYYGFLDAGICFDLAILRIGLAAGFDFVRVSMFEYGAYTAPGLNAKVNLDIKIARVSIGVSGTAPLDMLLRGGEVYSEQQELRVLALMPTVNIMYWFGAGTKSKRR